MGYLMMKKWMNAVASTGQTTEAQQPIEAPRPQTELEKMTEHWAAYMAMQGCNPDGSRKTFWQRLLGQ